VQEVRPTGGRFFASPLIPTEYRVVKPLESQPVRVFCTNDNPICMQNSSNALYGFLADSEECRERHRLTAKAPLKRETANLTAAEWNLRTDASKFEVTLSEYAKNVAFEEPDALFYEKTPYSREHESVFHNYGLPERPANQTFVVKIDARPLLSDYHYPLCIETVSSSSSSESNDIIVAGFSGIFIYVEPVLEILGQQALVFHNWDSRLLTVMPTIAPTMAPTRLPTVGPTGAPTKAPTMAPTKAPTVGPTSTPTEHPTRAPTTTPTSEPTLSPTRAPTRRRVEVTLETTATVPYHASAASSASLLRRRLLSEAGDACTSFVDLVFGSSAAMTTYAQRIVALAAPFVAKAEFAVVEGVSLVKCDNSTLGTSTLRVTASHSLLVTPKVAVTWDELLTATYAGKAAVEAAATTASKDAVTAGVTAMSVAAKNALASAFGYVNNGSAIDSAWATSVSGTVIAECITSAPTASPTKAPTKAPTSPPTKPPTMAPTTHPTVNVSAAATGGGGGSSNRRRRLTTTDESSTTAGLQDSSQSMTTSDSSGGSNHYPQQRRRLSQQESEYQNLTMVRSAYQLSTEMTNKLSAAATKFIIVADFGLKAAKLVRPVSIDDGARALGMVGNFEVSYATRQCYVPDSEKIYTANLQILPLQMVAAADGRSLRMYLIFLHITITLPKHFLMSLKLYT